MRNPQTGWMDYDSPTLKALHEKRKESDEQYGHLSWFEEDLTTKHEIWRWREIEYPKLLHTELIYQQETRHQMQHTDLYAHGWISLPDTKSLRMWGNTILHDEGLLLIPLTRHRALDEHWFIPFNPNFTLRFKARGYVAPWGKAISTDRDEVWVGMDALKAMWSSWLQYQHDGYGFCLDVLALYTHSNYIKHFPGGGGGGRTSYEYFVEAR